MRVLLVLGVGLAACSTSTGSAGELPPLGTTGQPSAETSSGSLTATTEDSSTSQGAATTGTSGAPATTTSGEGTSGGVLEPPAVDTVPDADEIPCPNATLEFTPPLDLDGPDDVDAFWMMWFSWRAKISESDAFAQELERMGFSTPELIDEPSAGLQAFVAHRPDATIVAFRGSEEILDWLTNLNFPRRSAASWDLPGHVHVGFAEALDAAYPQILAALVDVDPDTPIWVTGQSLGGAMAVLLAARLASQGHNVAPVYAFANPRSTDSVLAHDVSEQLDGAVYRYVNADDVVPRLPPAGASAEEAGAVLPLGGAPAQGLIASLDYLHAGTLFVHRDASWSQYAALDDSEDQAYWAGLDALGWWALLATTTQASAHDRDTYLCLMRQKAFGF